MRYRSQGPEHGGTVWLLAAVLAGLVLVALALLVGLVVGDDLMALDPGRLLTLWAARERASLSPTPAATSSAPPGARRLRDDGTS